MPQITVGKRTFEVADQVDGTTLLIDGKPQEVDILKVGQDRYSMIINGKSKIVEVVDQNDKEPVLKIDGQILNLKVKNDTDLLLERLGMNISGKKEVKELKAPMPGLVLDVLVEVGQEISEGDPLIVLEAMKMENILKAPADVKVKSVEVEKGQALDKNAILLKFD